MVTMTDIAKRAGVSRVTASFVLNQRHADRGVSESARLRVMAAAKELGYRPNGVARAMVTGKNRVLGFLAHSPQYEHTMQILEGVTQAAQDAGYFVKVIFLDAKTTDRDMLERCVESRMAGILAITLNDETLQRVHEEMSRHNIPIAVVESTLPQPWGICVGPDERGAMFQVVEHLAMLGHRNIGMIAGNHTQSPSILRRQFFVEVMEELNLEVNPAFLKYGMWSPDPTETAVREVLSMTGERPTALVCAADAMALVAIRTARSLGLSVPRDLSVVGIGDFSMAALSDPPLTTVQLFCAGLGRAAAGQLLARIESGPPDMDAPLKTNLPTQLVVRQSTGPA